MPDKQCIRGKDDQANRNHNVVDLTQYSWRRASQRLRLKLAEFADHEIFLEDMDLAREYFFAVLDDDFMDEDDEILLGRFFEWFIFDYRFRGRTMIEYFAKTGKIVSKEKELLADWKKAKTSFYQVVGVSAESILTLEDIIRGGQMVVNDSNAVHNLQPGQIMLMRILAVGDENEFSTGGLILPKESMGYILARVKLDAELYWEEYGRRGNWDAYLGARSHVLNAMAVEISSTWGLSMDEIFEVEKTDLTGEQYQELVRRTTGIFLDYFYDRLLNEPMGALRGKTPLEASRFKWGRQKLQFLLQELEKIEIAKAERGEPHYDLNGLRKKLGLFSGSVEQDLSEPKQSVSETGYAAVAQLIRERLGEMGHGEEIPKAVELWERYCRLACPAFRKPEAWAAAVIYTIAKLQGNDNIQQKDLAHAYKIPASTISNHYRNICKTLRLNN